MNNLELIQEAINTLQPLFEVGGPDEVPASTNKIIKTKKDKKGEPTDVVSVADELFPKEGNAKEQFHQKVIDKINDMIQGTATLEDLLQLVTRKQAAKKQVHEGLEEFGDKINILEEALIKVERQDRIERLGKNISVLEELINEVSKRYLDRKEKMANDNSQKLLIRSVLAANDNDKAGAKYLRGEFDKTQKRIKDFHEKAKDHIEKMQKKDN